MVKSVHTA